MAFITAETRSDLIELSVAMLKQAPSAALLEELIALSVGGGSLADAADHIAKTAAFKAEYPSFQTAEQYAAEIFDNITTGGTVTADLRTAVIELATGMLTSGSVTKSGLALAIAEYLAAPAALANEDFADIAQSFQNRAEAAEYFVVNKELGASTDAELAAAIASVTSDAATLTAANTAADATSTAVAVVAGKTLTLTTGVDALTGGAGNDTINGVVQANGLTGSTTSPGDVVTGGAGTDTLSISVAGDGTNAGYTLQAVQTNAVENIHVTNFDTNGTGTTTIDTSLMSGVESVGIAASNASGDTAFSNLTAIKNAKMLNGSADLTLTYVAGTTGTADVQNLTVSAVSAGSFSANGVETVAVTNSLTANKLTNITGSSLKAITVTGDQNFTMTGTSTVKGIDTSANTGKASLTLGAATHTVTTGAGDDTIDIGVNLSAADKIQGGDGTDTLKISAAGTINGMASAADVTAEFAQSGGFEVIDIASTNDAATLNLKNIAGVDTAKVAANVRGVTFAGSALAESATATITFALNGTTYTSTANLSGNAAADALAASNAVAATINALAGYDAVADGTSVVTITRTGGEIIELDVTNQTGATATNGDYSDVSVTGVTDQAVDVYSADSVTVRLVDPSGAEDVLNVNLKTLTTEKAVAQTVGTLDVADTIETLNLDASGMKTGTSATQKTLTTLTADSSLTTLNVTGSDKLTIGTLTAAKLATIDASAATGNVSLPGTASLTQTITMGSGNDTLVMGGNLTAADVIDMGANSVASALTGALGVDTVTTSGNQGNAVTSAALQISNAEVVTFAAGGAASNFIDGSNLDNVGLLAFSNTSGASTLTNMPAGTAVGLGITAAESTSTYTVALADATGAEDALSLVYGSGVDASTSNTIVVAGVETLNVAASKEALNNETSTLVLTNAAVSTINVSGGHAGDTTALGTLNKATTAVNAGSNKSIVSFDGATGVGVTVSAAGAVANVINLSTKADTVTLTGLLGTTIQDIDGGATVSASTSDTLSATLTSLASDFTSVAGFEVLNLSVPAATDVGFNATAKDGGLNTASVVNILGGNANSSFTVSTAEFDTSRSAATALTVDASTFGGSIDLQFAADALDIFTTIKGGASTADVVDTIISAAASATAGNNPKMSGVESLEINSTDGDTDAVINLGSAAGLAKVTAKFTTAGAADQIEIDSLAAGVPVYVAGTNAADNLDVGVAGATGSADALTIVSAANAAGLNLDAAGIEALNIVNAVTSTYDLAGVAPTATAETTVSISGAGNATLSALNTGITTVNAASLGGTLSLAASARDADALTVTGGVNNDTIAMENSADVLTGGTQAIGGKDTLVINYTAILGGITIDLSAADQVATMDGTVNSASQSGFESVDVRAFANFGAVITGSAGANIITGTVLADRIDAGKGNDTIQVALTNDANNDQINGGAGTDTFNILAGDYVPAADGNLIAVETITSAVAGTINLSNQSEAITVTGAAGAQVIIASSGKTTMTGGAAGDTFSFTAGSTGQAAATADVITDYTTTADEIDVVGQAITLVAEGTAGVGQAAIAADGTVTFNAADDTLAEQVIAVEAGMTAATAAAGEAAIFADPASAANSYIFISDGTAGVDANDILIHIIGDAAGALTLNAGNISAIA